MITKKSIFSFFLGFFSLFYTNALPRSMPIENETESSGAGTIIFDTSKLPLEEENSQSIFNYKFGNNNVDFSADGYWKCLVTGTTAYSFGFGTTAASSNPSIAFVQNVDLTMLLMLNNHWYFEAAFADEFERNTFAAGYQGDGYLKSARIANRGIIFPNYYSISELNRGIGGGENESFGFSVNFSGDKWRADGAIRYDLLSSEEKTWYGKNSVTTNEISLSSYLVGNQYALPNSEILTEIEDVYVENSSGSYRDSRGRKYKKLDSSQYLIIGTKNMLLISKDAKISKKAAVAIKLSSTGKRKFQNEIEDFLDDTNYWFKDVDLEKYYFFKGNRDKLFGQIDGDEILYIQYPTGFSPFICAFRYDCGSLGAMDAEIASKSTETVSTKYSVAIMDEDLSFAEKDFFSISHLYSDVFLSEENSTDCADPKIRFPLANEFSGIYLGLSDDSIPSDKILRVRTYTPVKRYEIGTKAIPGTIRVYKNGVIDSGATYDEETGTIELSTNVGNADKIHATWFTESEDSETGAIAAAAGFEYKFSKYFKSDISTSTRWTLAKDFSDTTSSSPGFFTIATGSTFENENWNISNTAGFSLENDNTTGFLRILGMDDKESNTSYFSKDDSVSCNISPILNLKNETIILDEDNNGSVEAVSGQNDATISGCALPVSWDFSENTTSSLYWAATSIKLASSNQLLSSASKFSIALKNIETCWSSGTRVFLQLGIEATKNSNIIEESYQIPTWEITSSTVTEEKNGWKIITLPFSDEQKSALSTLEKSDARIIITSTSNDNGTILIGPYEISGQSFYVKSDENSIVTSFQTHDYSLNNSAVKKFNKSINNVQEFDWKFSGNEKTSIIEAEKYFNQIDIQNYSEMNFYFKFENQEIESKTSFSFLDNDDSEFLDFTIDNSNGDVAVRALISYDYLKNISGFWHSATIDLDEETLKIDGEKISGSKGKIFVKKSNVPTRFKIKINPKFIDSVSNEEKIIKSGKLYIDELHLSGSKIYYTVQDKAKASYKKDGEILTIGEATILKDFFIFGSSNYDSKINDKGKNENYNVNANGGFKLTFTKIKLESEIAKNQASHKISSDGDIFSLFNFSEEYNFNKNDETLSKSNFVKIGKKDIFIEAKAEAESDNWSISQKSNAETQIKFGKNKITASAKTKQKVRATIAEKNEKLETENYATSWIDTTKLEIDKGKEKASKREVGGKVGVEHQLNFLQLTPSATFESNGIYRKTSEATFSDSSNLVFAFPFKVEKNSFCFSWKKIVGETEKTEKGGKYIDDTNELSKNIGEKSYLFSSIPFHDLYTDSIKYKLKGKIEGSTESDFYSTSYDFTWKRMFMGEKWDFFLPNMAQATFSRDIKSSTTTSDFYQAQLRLANNSFNMFGQTGLISYFNWYEQDEFNTSISVAAKIPKEKPNNITFLINAYTQATFYITNEDYLRTGIEGTFETKDDWNGKCTIVWKRKGQSLIIDGLVNLIRPSYDKSKITHTRTDSLNFSASCTSSTNKNTRKYGIEYSHLLDSQITKYVTINSSFLMNYDATWDKIIILTTILGIGCTIKF